MTNRKGQTLNRAKKILLAAAGVAALGGPVIVGILIGLGHVPAILAQVPIAIPTPVAAALQTLAQGSAPQPKTSTPVADPLPIVQAPLRYQDHRLVALLFDFTSTTADDQAHARTAGASYVQNLHPGDLATVIFADGDHIQVRQDFTDNMTQLQAAARNIPAATTASGIDTRLANISTVAKMIAGFPGNKALMYFSAGPTPSGPENQAALQSAVQAAKQANMAIFPIDIRASGDPALQAFMNKELDNLQTKSLTDSQQYGPNSLQAVADRALLDELKRKLQQTAATLSGGGRAMSATPQNPAGVSQEEYNRRLVFVQDKFGNRGNVLARTYLRYGAPDQIDTPDSTTAQIWRYNYLENFHSSTEFAFSQGKGAMHVWNMNINYPLPSVYEGTPVTDATLIGALKEDDARAGHNYPMKAPAGMPGRHTSMGVYPAGETSRITVPLDTLSGLVDIVAQVKMHSATGLPDRMMGMLRDSVTLAGTSQSGQYGSGFTLEGGSYICRVLVREAATGRVFTEEINFDVR